MDFQTGDMVKSPLFGKGIVIEEYGSKVVVNFENKVYGLRTVNKHIFADGSITPKPKKEVTPDYKEDYYNDINREDTLLTNDNLDG